MARTNRVLMIDGSPYNLVTAVNDQPLSPDEKAAEQRKLGREIEKRHNESDRERRHRIGCSRSSALPISPSITESVSSRWVFNGCIACTIESCNDATRGAVTSIISLYKSAETIRSTPGSRFSRVTPFDSESWLISPSTEISNDKTFLCSFRDARSRDNCACVAISCSLRS